LKDEIYLIRDVLDDQLVDVNDNPMGRADGIILEWREDAPPRVAAIEVGANTLAARLHPRLGAWTQKLGQRWGLRKGECFRIPFEKVSDCGIEIKLDVRQEETPALDYEHLLRERIVKHLPGSG
jgi:hypothetical protein